MSILQELIAVVGGQLSTVTLLLETFTAAGDIETRSPDIGPTAGKVSGGACTPTGGEGVCAAFCIYVWDVLASDFTMQITVVTASTDFVAEMGFRYVDAANKWAVSKNGTTLQLRKRTTAAGWTTEDTDTTIAGLPATFTIVCDGDNITVTDEHGASVSTTDSTHNSATIVSIDDNAGTMTVDDLLVTTPA